MFVSSYSTAYKRSYVRYGWCDKRPYISSFARTTTIFTVMVRENGWHKIHCAACLSSSCLIAPGMGWSCSPTDHNHSANEVTHGDTAGNMGTQYLNQANIIVWQLWAHGVVCLGMSPPPAYSAVDVPCVFCVYWCSDWRMALGSVGRLRTRRRDTYFVLVAQWLLVIVQHNPQQSVVSS